jgi:predicted RNase H-like HicB family nuclease
MTILAVPSIDGVAQSQPWPMKKYQEFEINYFQDEDGVFTAQVPAIPGCVAWGQTLEEAYQAAVEAIESCLAARRTIAAAGLVKPRYAGLNI